MALSFDRFVIVDVVYRVRVCVVVDCDVVVDGGDDVDICWIVILMAMLVWLVLLVRFSMLRLVLMSTLMLMSLLMLLFVLVFGFGVCFRCHC